MTSHDRRRLYHAHLLELMGTDTTAGIASIEQRYAKAVDLADVGLITVPEALDMVRGLS